MNCPNINLPQWKSLVAEIGEFEAFREFIKNNGEIPDISNYQSNGIYNQLKPQIVQKASEKLDATLQDYLKNWGIVTEELNDFKNRFGMDSLGVADTIQKIIYLSSNRDLSTMPEEAAHMIVMLMGKEHPLLKDVLKNIDSWSQYDSIRKQYLDKYEGNEQKVKIEAVSHLIRNAITEKFSSENPVQLSLFQKIKKLILDFYKSFIKKSGLPEDVEFAYSKESVSKIADAILSGNTDLINSQKSFSWPTNVDYNNAINRDSLSRKIINDFTEKLPFKLTGSLAIAKQTNIQRYSGEQIHDIDFVVPNTWLRTHTEKEFDELLNKPNIVPVRIIRDVRQTTTKSYLIAEDGYTIKQISSKISSSPMMDIDVFDREGNKVSVLETLKVVKTVDFFLEAEKERIFFDNVASWQDVMEGKLQLSNLGTDEVMFDRKKDQTDYININPTNIRESRSQNLYYQKDEESILNQVKEEAKGIRSVYGSLLQADTREALWEVAVQANSSASERSGVTKATSENIVNLALQLFPNAKVGDKYAQLDGSTPSKANAKTLSLIREAMKRLGIQENALSKILVDGKEIGANGIAKPLEALVEYIYGKEDTVLPEEAMHIVVELLKLKNPSLYKQMQSQVSNYLLYRTVFDTYKETYTKDGKPDVVKIKDEAIAKLLVEHIIKQTEGSLEKPENIAKVKTFWNTVKNFLKTLFNKLGTNFFQDVFEKEATNVLNVQGHASELNTDTQFYQLDNSPKGIRDRIKEAEKGISEHGTHYEVNGEKLDRVSNVTTKPYYESIFGKKNTDDKLKKEYTAESGTDIHADMETIFHKLVGDDGLLRTQAEEAGTVSIAFPNNPEFFNSLYDYMKTMLSDKTLYPEGTIFLSETLLADMKNKVAGKADFIAILPDGRADILDWKSINLNPNKYSDIPSYKAEAFNRQIKEYRRILKEAYGVKDFRYTRAIPMRTTFLVKDNVIKLTSVEIGNPNPKSETRDYLLPVATDNESTGNTRIDKLIVKLQALAGKISAKPAVEGRKDLKKEQLNALFSAIRHLQVKQSVAPLANQIGILLKNSKMTMENVSKEIKDNADLTPEQIEEYAEQLNDAHSLMETYRDIDVYLSDLQKSATEEELKDFVQLDKMASDIRISLNEIKDVINQFGEKYITSRQGIEGILDRERVVSGVKKWLSRLSKMPPAALQALYTITQKAEEATETGLRGAVDRLNVIQKDLAKWGKPLAYNNLIQKKDKNGKNTNRLINQYDPEFFTEYNKRVEAKDIQWIKDNVDIDKVTEAIKDYKAKKLAFINAQTYFIDETADKERKEKEIDMLNALTDLNGTFSWFNNKLIRNFPTTKHYSKEYQELSKKGNEPVMALYNFIREWNDYANKVGYLDYNKKRNFLPYMRKGVVERVLNGQSLNLINNFVAELTVDDTKVGMGHYDPVNNEIQNTIPKYFTTDISQIKEDGTKDYSMISEDLTKNMAIYIGQVLNYENKSKIEESAKLLLDIEKNKGSFRSNMFGKIVAESERNDENAQLYEDYLRNTVYGQSFLDVKDLASGTLGKSWNNMSDKVNNKLGMKIVPKVSKGLEDNKISLVNTIMAMNKYFQIKTLGLNIPTSLAQFLGGNFQAIIKAGTYYNSKTFLANEFKHAGHKLIKNNYRIHGELIHQFMPIEGQLQNEIRKLSGRAITQHSVQNVIMGLMRQADHIVTYANFLSFMDNTIIKDGKMQNARIAYRNSEEYTNRYNLTESERKTIESNFESKVQELIEQYGIEKLSKVNADGTVDLGIDMNDESVQEYRSLLKTVSARATGTIRRGDEMRIRMSVLGRSVMVFKNWIPDLIDQRFGELQYNKGTDSYEYGRMRMMMKLISKDVMGSVASLINVTTFGATGFGDIGQIRKGTDKGIALLEQMYLDAKSKYEEKNGKEFKMNKEEFFDMIRQNIKSQLKETIMLLSLLGLLVAAKAVPPDPDEDPGTKSAWKYMLKSLNKVQDELSFYYNPMALQNVVNGSMLPSIGVLSDFMRILTNFSYEMFGFVIQDDKIIESAHPTKYLMKTFPIAKVSTDYIAIFAPDLAKELGIQINAQQQQR